MPVSPICLVADGLGPFLPTSGGVNVGPGDTISIKLADTTNVAQWYLQVSGTDELSSVPSLTNVNPSTNLVATPSSTVTFVYPNARGRAILFTSTVTGPGGPVVTTFTIYTLTSINKRVGAAGEEREGSSAYGWITIVNPIIRTGAGALFYDDTLSGPLLGASTIQAAIDIIKSTPTFVAGGDLSGTATNQTVIGIQTRPVASTAPGSGQFLGWTGSQWAPLTITSINGMPVPLSTTGNHLDFLRVQGNPFVETAGAIWDGSRLWVGNNGSNTIVEADTSTNPPTATKILPMPQFQNAAIVGDVDSTHVYVYGGVGDKLLLVNKTTYAIEGVIDAARPPAPPNYTGIFTVKVNSDDIYVASGTSSNDVQLDRYSKSATLAAFPSPGTSAATLAPPDASGFGDLTFGGGFLFSVTDNPTVSGSALRKHDPATLAILDSYTSGTTNDFFNRITYAFGSVWMTRAVAQNVVDRFNPTNLAAGPTAFVNIPTGNPTHIVADASTIWITNGSSALYRISTGAGTEAIIATVAGPTPENANRIASDGTYIWVPVYANSGTGPNDGLRNCSTGLGTEAYVSLWTGPIQLQYDPVFPNGDLGYLPFDPDLRVLSLQKVPILPQSGVTPGSTLEATPVTSSTNDGTISNPYWLAKDPFSPALWASDRNGQAPGFSGFGALIRMDTPTDAYPRATILSYTLPTNSTVGLSPHFLAVDDGHVIFGTGTQQLVGIVDKATNALVGLCSTGPADANKIAVNSDDIYVNSNSQIQKFSKKAAILAFPTPVTATATLPVPGGTSQFESICFGGGFIYASATQPGPVPQVFKIDPTGAMSIVATWTGAAGSPFGADTLFAFGSVWVVIESPNTLYRFDPAAIAGGPIATVTLPLGAAFGLASDTNSIWVSDTGPNNLSVIAKVSTTLGAEAVTGLLQGNMPDSLGGLAFDGTYLWAADFTNALQRYVVGGTFGDSFDLTWSGNLQYVPQAGANVVTRVGGSTLDNSDRYVIYGGPGTGGDIDGAHADTLFLPQSPALGQKHTISYVGNAKGTLHGNGHNVDGFPSISFGTKSDALFWNDTKDPSITVTWQGTAWKIDAYGGSNPMALGDLTGKQRRNRLRHIGPIGVPNLPIASTPGALLGIGVGSNPVVVSNATGECDINRTGSNDFVRYNPAANPPAFSDTIPIRLPEKWVCTNAVNVSGNYLVGDKNSGRLALLEYPGAGDEPGIAQIYNLPYARIDVVLASGTPNLFYITGGQANFLATFDLTTEKAVELANNRGYNSLVDGGNGFLYGVPSDSSGTVHKINPTTGALVLSVLCPDGATSGLRIGTTLNAPGLKLIITNSVNQHYYSFNVASDSFDGVNFNLSGTTALIQGVASDGTSLAFIGTGTGAGPVIFEVTSPVTTPTLGTVITLAAGASLTGIVYQSDAAFSASYIITDGGRDLILHVDTTTFAIIVENSAAGLLTIMAPPTTGDNGAGIRSGPQRPFLADNQIGSLEAIFVHTPYVDGITPAGLDLVISERHLLFTASQSHGLVTTTINATFTPGLAGGAPVNATVVSTTGLIVGGTLTISQLAPAFSGSFIVSSIVSGAVVALRTISTTGTPPFNVGATVTFAAGTVDGQLYSTELAGHQTGLDFSMPAEFPYTNSFSNPTTLIGLGVPFNNFNTFAVSPGGAISNYIYETIHSTQNDSNIIWPAGLEDWTGARACYVYTTQETGTYGDFAELFFTAPVVNKLYQGNIFFDTGDPSFEPFDGESPRAICAAGDNTFWVSFIGGIVPSKLRKYQVTATGTVRPTYAQVGPDVLNVGSVYELLFDGKYLWALSADGTNGTLYKLDQIGNILGSFVFTSGSVTSASRMCSDGSSVWMTRGTVITRVYSEGPVIPLFELNIPGGGFTQARGIVCDPHDNTIYVACYGTFLSIYAWHPPTGGWSESQHRRAVWKTNSFGMPTTFVATDFATLGAIGPATTRTFEIDITAINTPKSGSWKKYVTVQDDGTNLTIIGTVADIVPPMLSSGAITDGWDVTIATAASTYSAGTTLQVTITQGTSTGATDWTLDIKETRTFGGAL